MCGGEGVRSYAFARVRPVEARAFATIAVSTTNISGRTLVLSRLRRLFDWHDTEISVRLVQTDLCMSVCFLLCRVNSQAAASRPRPSRIMSLPRL